MCLSVNDWCDESGKRKCQIIIFFKLHLRVIRTVRTVFSGMCENPIRVGFKV